VPIAVTSIVDEALSGVDDPRVRVDVDAGVGDRTVYAPPRAVTQALRGVVENARHAARASVVLRVRADAAGCRIDVQDDGPGMADDVLAVMDALGVKAAAIVGWSDGGEIALDLAVNHPERVSKLFVFGANYDVHGTKPRPKGSATFSAYAAKCRADFSKIAPDPRTYDATASALLPVWRDPKLFTKDQLRSIQAPTLVADGDHDEIIALDQVKEMATLIPNARLVVFRDASHFALWQDPAAFNAALVDFLGR